MISLQQFRSFFLSLSFAVMLAIAMAFGFSSANSWAATSLTQLTSQPPTQIATINPIEAIKNNIKGMAQEVMGDKTDDSEVETTGAAKQLEANTQKATDISIDNPNYQPSGKTKQIAKQSREASENIKAEAREALNKNNISQS